MKTLSNNANVSETDENEAIEKERLRLIRVCNNRPKSYGRTQMLRFLNGERLTPKQAVQADCFDCMRGLRDCINSLCAAFGVSKYKDKDCATIEERGGGVEQLIKDYQENTITSSGKTQYLRYIKGEKLTYTQIMLARCAECTCGYADGRVDCKMPLCTLYGGMPYRGKKA